MLILLVWPKFPLKFNKYLKILVLIVILAFTGRIFLAQFGTYYNDLYSLQLWSLDLIRYGFQNFYQVAKADYPPGYLYFLWFTGKVYYWTVVHLPQLASVEVIYKLPSILTDIGCGIFIFLIAKKYTTEKKALITAIIFLFNPAIFADSTLWGQIESFLVFFLLSSFYFLLSGRFWLSALLLAFAQTVKPIAALVLPFYLLYILKVKRKAIFMYVLLFVVALFAIFIPFNKDQNLISFVIQRHTIMSEWFPYITLSAFNFWGVISVVTLGALKSPSDQALFLNVTYENWGRIIFLSIYFVTFIITYLKMKTAKTYPILLSFAITAVFTAMFLFLTRMRERHLFFGLSFLTLLLPIFSLKKIIIIIPVYLIFLFNLYYGYVLPSDNPLVLPSYLIIAIFLWSFGVFIYLLKVFGFEENSHKKLPD